MAYLKSTNPASKGILPVSTKKGSIKEFSYYKNKAFEYLVGAVNSYKKVHGDSMPDQKLLIAEEFRYQMWFVMPSDVYPEIS